MLQESPAGPQSVKRQQSFLQKVLPNDCPKPVWKAFSAIPAGSFTPGLVSPLPWTHCCRWRSPETAVIRGVGGMRLEKIARRGFGGSQVPKRACILHFKAAIFPRSIEKKSDIAEEILPEMRKKLDYERFLGYTSTGFESGG